MPSRNKGLPKNPNNRAPAFDLLAGLPDDFDPRVPVKPQEKQVPPLSRAIRKRIARLRSE